mmetsp:Transcript_47973/g.120034  ORF Transcript_47973/g.120034 Transcript_47973/m.120034 type:complete len:255 (+) Transcript_47973:3896-4660(+)
MPKGRVPPICLIVAQRVVRQCWVAGPVRWRIGESKGPLSVDEDVRRHDPPEVPRTYEALFDDQGKEHRIPRRQEEDKNTTVECRHGQVDSAAPEQLDCFHLVKEAFSVVEISLAGQSLQGLTTKLKLIAICFLDTPFVTLEMALTKDIVGVEKGHPPDCEILDNFQIRVAQFASVQSPEHVLIEGTPRQIGVARKVGYLDRLECSAKRSNGFCGGGDVTTYQRIHWFSRSCTWSHQTLCPFNSPRLVFDGVEYV